MEYPPGALAVFLPPSAFGSSHYNAAFKCLMALCGVATLLVAACLLVRLGVSTLRLWAGLLLFALSPVALGPISLNTYDAWPSFLTVAALALLLSGRELTAFALLGAAFAAKLYPVVLVPPAAIFAWRTHGRALALQGLAVAGGVAALFVLPFLVLAPHGLAESFRTQAARSLQVESLGGSLLALADRLGLYSASVAHRTGHAISYDLVGTLPEIVAVLSSIAQALAVVAVVWLYARGRDEPRRVALAFAAAIAGFLAFTRFFSPQYAVWLIPFVVLLQPAAWVIFAAALFLAQVWFFHYADVFALGGYVWLVVMRDLLVAVLFVVTLMRLRRPAPEHEDAVLLEHEPPLRIPS
jgi:uncharacterized membrane protein